MVDCIVHPIAICKGTRDRSVWTYLSNFAQVVEVGQYVWYIEGPREKILVDAGSSSKYAAAMLGQNYQEIATLESGLCRLGLSPGDIDLVILTHLHYDHVAQASKLFKAKFLIQQDELEFAHNPHPVFAMAYPKIFFEGLNFEIIDGDAKICDEVSVLKTPGHTPGGQSVSINTARGNMIISGLCTVRENFKPINTSNPVIAPGIHTNPLDAYDSVLYIKEMADIVIPLHDSEYLKKTTIP